ncbi:hypothetical protein WMY93_032997 [Mugilogobius chulae]|uniref:Ig-like domain-containing protein n=1 Tax=Mugilogobius chulae TaxID=88201 RepID=A0AAW0MMK8_9GOBI
MESALCTLLSALVVLLCSSPECKGEDTVSQPAGDVLLTQGKTVKIECTFQTIDNTPTLFWYKQGRGAPEYMMRKRKSTSSWYDTYKSPKFNEEKFEFKVEAEKNTVSLKIRDVDVTDSAVYYCALRPTVTGNTKTLNKNLWSKDNTILHSSHFTPNCRAQSSRELREEPDSLVVLLCSSPECKGEDTFKEEKFEFKVEAEKNTVSLKIQDVDVTDSAVYYCALRPTVTGNTKTLDKNLWSKDNTILQ